MTTIEDLTPEEREAVQVRLLHRVSSLRCPRGTRRRTDHAPSVRRFSLSGDPLNTIPRQSPLSGKNYRGPNARITS